MRPVFRAPILLLALASLLAALWGGLIRIGVPLPGGATLATAHGPLIAVGFLGTLITLERAVATGRTWAFGAAAATGLGSAAVALAAGTNAGPALMTAGALGLLAAYGVVLSAQAALSSVTMAAGAALLLLGNLLWALGWSIPEVVPFWGGFLLLTIAGERLELSRLAAPSRRATVAFAGLVLAFLGGIALGALGPRACPVLAAGPLRFAQEHLLAAAGVAPELGARVSGAAILGLVAWLAIHDVARRTIRIAGLPRYAATCIFTGYFWLAVHGGLSLAGAPGFGYDARWHSLFLGFVFAMIFGHAPIVLPAVLGTPLPFDLRFYIPLSVMQAGLLARVAGDLAAWPALRTWGGALNAIAIVVFLAGTATGIVRARLSARQNRRPADPIAVPGEGR